MITLTFLSALLNICGMWATGPETDRFKISTKRAEDRIETIESKQSTTLAFHSPSGIGQATIERLTDSWPEKLILRFPFKGLEQFKIVADKIKLIGSISSHDGTIRVWKDGHESTPLDSKSAYWLKIHILDRNGAATKRIPLSDGVIQIELPKKLLEGSPANIQVEWIDFYRN